MPASNELHTVFLQTRQLDILIDGWHLYTSFANSKIHHKSLVSYINTDFTLIPPHQTPIPIESMPTREGCRVLDGYVFPACPLLVGYQTSNQISIGWLPNQYKGRSHLSHNFRSSYDYPSHYQSEDSHAH